MPLTVAAAVSSVSAYNQFSRARPLRHGGTASRSVGFVRSRRNARPAASRGAVVRAAAAEEEDGDWSPGPFLRPEGSPYFGTYTDPTVWKLMQEVLIAVRTTQD